MKLASKIAVGLLASLSLTAIAQTAPVNTMSSAPHPEVRPGQGPEHKGITRAEVLAKAGARFDAADANKDGVLTRDERRAERKKVRDQRRHHLDGAEHAPGHAPGKHKGPPPPHGDGPGPAPAGELPQR